MQARDPLGVTGCFIMESTDRPKMVRTNAVPIRISAAEKPSQRVFPVFYEFEVEIW